MFNSRTTSLLAIAVTLSVSAARADDNRPAIDTIEVFPERLVLRHVRDARSLIVTGRTAEGIPYDLTTEAKLQPASKHVNVEDGFVTPAEQGETTVSVTAAGKTVEVPVTVEDVSPRKVSFVREVMPVTSKVGCNAGTCHGARAGKNGFKLSLRGYDPAYDYRALVDDVSGRRFNRARPSQSLMLLKPTQGVPHEGGFLFEEDSRPYRLIEQWIAEGCQFDSETTRVTHVEIFPREPILQRAGQTQQHQVLAHYEDGTTADVTRDAVFETSDFEVATIDESGLVTAVRRGEAAVLVRYEGAYATTPVMVIGDRSGYAWNDSPEYNFVDTHVNDKLRRMKILPSELCTDAEFVRRLYLDLTGAPPTLEQTKAFLDDQTPSRKKREQLVDHLLASPGYVDNWTLKWSDLLMSNRKYVTEKGVWAFRNWIRHSIATNKPYDQFVRELITANGNTFENPAANYYRIAREPKAVMENMTQVFLGTRFMCAQCHDHPFERWTQNQYYELSAFFAAVGRKKGATKDEEIVYGLRNPRQVVHAGTGQAVQAVFPYEHEGYQRQTDDALREQLADWLTAPENELFTKSIVNRYWSYFTGRGMVDPVDDIRASNPPSNPALLQALTDDFVEHGFDLKRLVRNIVTSHTYQRSYQTNEFNEDDLVNYSHAIPRRLQAEQLYDAIQIATGAPSDIPGLPDGFRATQIPDPGVKVPFLDMFGRPPRESPCECERANELSLKQTLNLVNGPTVAKSIAHPKGLIARSVANGKPTSKLIDDVYLATLCRHPTKQEQADATAYFAKVGDDAEAGQDLMWALINTSAFLFNR